MPKSARPRCGDLLSGRSRRARRHGAFAHPRRLEPGPPSPAGHPQGHHRAARRLYLLGADRGFGLCPPRAGAQPHQARRPARADPSGRGARARRPLARRVPEPARLGPARPRPDQRTQAFAAGPRVRSDPCRRAQPRGSSTVLTADLCRFPAGADRGRRRRTERSRDRVASGVGRAGNADRDQLRLEPLPRLRHRAVARCGDIERYYRAAVGRRIGRRRLQPDADPRALAARAPDRHGCDRDRRSQLRRYRRPARPRRWLRRLHVFRGRRAPVAGAQFHVGPRHAATAGRCRGPTRPSREASAATPPASATIYAVRSSTLRHARS